MAAAEVLAASAVICGPLKFVAVTLPFTPLRTIVQVLFVGTLAVMLETLAELAEM
jgi:hypothetical protein